MLKRRASSRVLGNFCPGFKSKLTMPSIICVANCSRTGTSLFFESQIRIRFEKLAEREGCGRLESKLSTHLRVTINPGTGFSERVHACQCDDIFATGNFA